MIRNYFIIAWRNLKNNLLFSLLNVLGLSIGMACCLITALFAYQEYNYDSHHEKAERIYRVVNQQIEANREIYVGASQGTLAPELIKIFPEIEAATRVSYKDASLYMPDKEPEKVRVMAVDPSYFSIFTIPFKRVPAGDIIPVDGILLSEYAAIRIFGTKNPIGETLSLDNNIHLKVNGVFENFPLTSHLLADFIISFTWIEKTEPQASSWSSNSYYNYVLMPEKFDKPAFNEKLNTFVHAHTSEGWQGFNYFLQPLRKINLAPGYIANPRGSIGIILINGFIMVSLIILLLASFNYMNLATARSARRALEVGIRKVVGAVRMQLVRQFLVESLILCFVSFLLAILWADLGIQFFNSFTGFGLALKSFFGNPKIVLIMIALLIAIAVGSGGYPAFFLSRFVPSAVLKGQRSSDSGRRLRKGLVIFQFSLTGILVMLVIVVLKQTNYMKEKDLGFNKNNLIVFNADRNSNIGIESFKTEFKKIPGVKQIASATKFPSNRNNIRADVWKHGKTKDEGLSMLGLYADQDYIPTLQLTLLAGRNFIQGGKDHDDAAILNERALAAFGWTPEEAIGKKIVGFAFTDSLPGEVVGVVKDYNISPVRREILPLVIGYSPDNVNYMMRVEGNLNQIRQQVDQVGARYTHGDKFECMFLEDVLEENIAAETKTGQILTFFTFLAILIGCSGLYALSAFEGEQRIKELGIRKIMGASTQQLLFILSRDFLKLILISLFVAMPLSYFLGNIWLNKYPYHIAWSVGIFTMASGFILGLGWFTILTQALKASRLNPADALRYE